MPLSQTKAHARLKTHYHDDKEAYAAAEPENYAQYLRLQQNQVKREKIRNEKAYASWDPQTYNPGKPYHLVVCYKILKEIYGSSNELMKAADPTNFAKLERKRAYDSRYHRASRVKKKVELATSNDHTAAQSGPANPMNSTFNSAYAFFQQAAPPPSSSAIHGSPDNAMASLIEKVACDALINPETNHDSLLSQCSIEELGKIFYSSYGSLGVIFQRHAPENYQRYISYQQMDKDVNDEISTVLGFKI